MKAVLALTELRFYRGIVLGVMELSYTYVYNVLIL